MPHEVFFIKASEKDTPEEISEKARRVFLKTGLGTEITAGSLTALKIHFGEKGNSGYIKPAWLSGIIAFLNEKKARAFITDSNTLYVGNRSNSVDHLKLADEHGFSLHTLGIPVLIADGLVGREGDEIEVNLPRVKTAKIAGTFVNSDVFVALTHFTGHIMSGFGAAIKNVGMGCASRAGKLEQHSDVHPWINPRTCVNCGKCLDFCPADALDQKEEHVVIVDAKCIGCGECLVVCPVGAVKMRWDADGIRVQEKMAEYAYGVCRLFDGKTGFINFLLYITKDCDCMSQKGRIISKDIGILSSRDPVALDQASVDLLLEANGEDVLRKANDVSWDAQLRHAENIGLGSRKYSLVPLV